MILAAGEGTRMQPLTRKTPKVLLPVAGKPIIEHIIAWLHSYGISRIAVNLFHLGDKIREHLGDGSRWGVDMVYSDEPWLLGTAGGVKRLATFYDSTLVVVYGDVMTSINLDDMKGYHRDKGSMVTIALR